MAAKQIAEKFSNLQKVLKHNNGVVGTFLSIFRTDEAKWGDLIGEDKFGNKYYQNKYYIIGRSRWVEFSPQNYGWDYDGSQVPAEWHKWLHYVTDKTPLEAPGPDYKFLIDHKENHSGNPLKEYVPYSTVKPKIAAWVPPPGK